MWLRFPLQMRSPRHTKWGHRGYVPNQQPCAPPKIRARPILNGTLCESLPPASRGPFAGRTLGGHRCDQCPPPGIETLQKTKPPPSQQGARAAWVVCSRFSMGRAASIHGKFKRLIRVAGQTLAAGSSNGRGAALPPHCPSQVLCLHSFRNV